jgi:hypothetical protein
MQKDAGTLITAYAGRPTAEEFVDSLRQAWHHASADPDFQAREDYGELVHHVSVLAQHFDADVLTEAQQDVLAEHLRVDEAAEEDEEEEEEEDGEEDWPDGFEPMRMDVHPADSPEVVARPHGTVRVFNVPAANAVVLDVAQPLHVMDATRAIAYFNPADARALGEELLAASMAAERYAREGYR